MQITEVVVSAGRTFNHPFESFSNFRPEVTVSALIQEGEDPDAAVKQLQQKAETLVENQKNAILAHLRNLKKTEAEVGQLEARIATARARLDQLRPGQQGLTITEEEEPPF